MFQTKVNERLPIGIEGEYADDSPRRDTGFILLANTTEGAAATGTLAFAANPTANDTITIGSVVYRFVETLEQPNDIKIGSALADTLASLEKTINGEGEPGVDYFAGTTTPLANVTAVVDNSDLKLTSTEEGLGGNAIALASSAENVTVTAFTGGTDEVSRLPHFGYAFTQSEQGDDFIQVGGEGTFKGILVNPKMYANYLDLKPSLTLPNGSQGSVCDFGHVFVRSQSAFKVDMIAAFDKTTGAISAYVNAEAVPANASIIPNAKFIQYSGDSNTVGVLQLGN